MSTPAQLDKLVAAAANANYLEGVAESSGDSERKVEAARAKSAKANKALRDALRETATVPTTTAPLSPELEDTQPLDSAACPECDGVGREFLATKFTRSSAPDGRLRMHEVTVFVDELCVECGHSFKQVDLDEFLFTVAEFFARRTLFAAAEALDGSGELVAMYDDSRTYEELAADWLRSRRMAVGRPAFDTAIVDNDAATERRIAEHDADLHERGVGL